MTAQNPALPDQALPYQASPATLGRATIAATAGAAAILLLFVLPAEWGVDVTGFGKLIGLTRMADTPEDDGGPTLPEEGTAPVAAVPPQVKETIEARTKERQDEKTFTIAPHSGMEVKAHMAQGDHLIFRWTSTAPIRMDMHGEPKNGRPDEFSTYWKQKNLTEAQGSFTAPFEGTHGWYWRNGGDTPATITLKTAGFYADLFEPPVE